MPADNRTAEIKDPIYQKGVSDKQGTLRKERALAYCEKWNEENAEIEKLILNFPPDKAFPLVLPQMKKWKTKMQHGWMFQGLSFEDAFSDTLYYMYLKGFDEFKKKKESGADVHIYPFFLKKFKAYCYRQNREKKGFKSDQDYNVFLKIKRICEEYDVKMRPDNAYLFSVFTDESFACIMRVMESYKQVRSFDEIRERSNYGISGGVD